MYTTRVHVATEFIEEEKETQKTSTSHTNHTTHIHRNMTPDVHPCNWGGCLNYGMPTLPAHPVSKLTYMYSTYMFMYTIHVLQVHVNVHVYRVTTCTQL